MSSLRFQADRDSTVVLTRYRKPRDTSVTIELEGAVQTIYTTSSTGMTTKGQETDHFRVSKTLAFKMRLSGKPFL